MQIPLGYRPLRWELVPYRDWLESCSNWPLGGRGWHSCYYQVGGPPREGVSVDFDSQGGVAILVKGGAQISTMMGDHRGSRVHYP